MTADHQDARPYPADPKTMMTRAGLSRASDFDFARLANAGLERLPLGIPTLDVALGGGVRRGSVITIGGLPGVGKTDLAIGMAISLSATVPMVYLTVECSAEDLAQRALVCCSNAYGDEGLDGIEEFARLAREDPLAVERVLGSARAYLSNLFFADDTVAAEQTMQGFTVEGLTHRLASMAKQTGVRFGIVIDYLQQARTDPQLAGATTVDILDRETRVIASYAHSLNVPAIVLTSLSKQRDPRGSNTITYGTDLMLTLECGPDGMSDDVRTVTCTCSKNRNGRVPLPMRMTYVPARHLFT